MSALVFSSEDALLVALRTAKIRPRAGVTFRWWREEGREGPGAIGVELEAVCSKAELEVLKKSGAKPAKTPATASTARSFIELIRPRALTAPELDAANILFVAGEEKSLLELAAELLRLGCDRQFHALQSDPTGTQTLALLRAHHPPYYTLAASLERAARVRAFAPVQGTDGRVYVELGFAHPLAESIAAPEKELRLLTREGELLAVHDGPWTELYSVLDVVLPEAPVTLKAIALSKKLEVKLRLVRAARSENPSLWILRDNGVQAIDRLLSAVPEEISSRFLFAVAEHEDSDQPIVLLKTRGGRGGDPSVDLPGAAYVPLLSLPNVYVPLGTSIEPPLRRDRLRTLFAPAAEEIAWLVPKNEHEFFVERIRDSAFSPLSEWVEYVAHSSASVLESWVRSATFELEKFQSIGAEWAEAPKAEKKEIEPEKIIKTEKTTAKTASAPRTAQAKTQAVQPLLEAEPAAASGPQLTADQQALSALEQQFVDMSSPLDHPDRVAAWMAIGDAQTNLNDLDEASLCFAHAIWESTSGREQGVIASWMTAELRAGSVAAIVDDCLRTDKPRRTQVRRAASLAIAAASLMKGPDALFTELGEHRGELQVWLERHDVVLDVRTAWLANRALAHLAGGDPLHLARTRDRMLTRLHTGLSLERDVPRFLRYLGGGKPRAGVHVDRLVTGLENFLARFLNTSRKRNPVEAPEPLTRAYVFLEFAYGFARLGRSERARALRTAALVDIPKEDPIHTFLRNAYVARIDQALEAKSLDTPLPPQIAGALSSLESFARYKVDRLRQASQVLEPVEGINTFQGFLHGERAELKNLRSIADPDQLYAELSKLIDAQATKPADERARVLDAAMDFYALVPGRAIELLDRTLPLFAVIPDARRALLLEEALAIAGTLGETMRVRQLLGDLTATIDRLKSEDCAAVAAELGRSLRRLRRAGLGDESAAFIQRLRKKLDDSAMIARIQVASALSFLGDFARSKPDLLAAHRELETNKGTPAVRMQAIRALANAWSLAPEGEALRGLLLLEPYLAQVTDSYNTNSHFCLSVIELIDALVLGYASEDLALGDRGRRFLDEDEHLVRRRIHQDLAQKEGAQ